MRVTGAIEYEVEHDSCGAGVIATWSVPYSAWMSRNEVEEVEADGMPTLVKLELQVGDVRRELQYPDPVEMYQWQVAWTRSSRYCESELIEKFTRDCVEQHFRRREEAAGVELGWTIETVSSSANLLISITAIEGDLAARNWWTSSNRRGSTTNAIGSETRRGR